MISAAKILLGLINLVNVVFTWMKNKQLIDAGHDKAVAMAAEELLLSTERGKRLREYIRRLPDDEADKLWNEMLNV